MRSPSTTVGDRVAGRVPFRPPVVRRPRRSSPPRISRRRVWQVTGAAAVGIAVWLAIASGSAAARAPHLRIVWSSVISGPPLGVGACGAGGANNPLVAVDPQNPRRLVATYLVGSTGSAPSAAAALSRDGGRSWRRVPLAGMGICGGGVADSLSDPYLAFGLGERVYVDESGVSAASDPNATNLYLAASTDGGASFSRAVSPLADQQPSQRGPLSPDPAHPGSVSFEYESWNPSEPLGSTPWSVAVARWGGSATRPMPTVVDRAPLGKVSLAVGLLRSGRALVAINARISLAQASGYLAGVAGSKLTQYVYARRSDDDGATFGPPSPVGDLVMRLGDPGGCCLISSAQAHGGTMYLTWTALSGRSGGEALLFRSEDGGATWKRLSVATTATRSFESSVAVAPDGHVGVLWLQGAPRTGPSRSASDVIARFASSQDQGQRWSSMTLTSPLHVARGVNLADGGTLGEYQGLIGVPSGFGVALTTVAHPNAARARAVVRYLRIAG
jgi:hypothetical protein